MTTLRATHRPSRGAHGFFGVMSEMQHDVIDSADAGTSLRLHALAACLTADLAHIAAARAVTLTEIESTLEDHADQIRVHFTLRGDEPDRLRSVVERSRQRTTAYEVLTDGVPVTVDVDAR